MRLRGASLVGTALGVLAAVTLSVVAYAAEEQAPGPVITSVSVSHITKNGATVTAVMNPEGTETKYEVELTWKEKCGKRHCEKFRRAGTGTLAGANRLERVSVHLAGLKAHTSYLVSVGATNQAGSTRLEDENGFKTK